MNLFPRNPGPRHCEYHWARCWAHRVLDAARAGLNVDDDTIAQALRVLGDIT